MNTYTAKRNCFVDMVFYFEGKTYAFASPPPEELFEPAAGDASAEPPAPAPSPSGSSVSREALSAMKRAGRPKTATRGK